MKSKLTKIITTIFTILLSIVVFSQVTTVYTEDFSNDWKKGAVTYGGITPAQPTDGNWSWVSVGSPANDGGSATSWNDMAFMDGAAVMSTNGSTSSTLAFRWNDVNNGSTANRVDWYSKSISGAYTTITASLSYAIGNGSGSNSVWAYYKIDGGAWTLFGSSVNQSTASGTFTSSTLSCTSSIQIKVEALTRNSNSAYVTIDNVQITACPVVVPSVSITASSNNICSGTSVTFTATPTNGGAGPNYQWKLNSTNVGTNSTTYTNSGLTNDDIVSCVMTSNASCVSPTTATSNSVTMVVTNTSVGGTASSDQTIYSGQNASDMSVFGITGSVTKWQYTNDMTFTTSSELVVTNSTLLGTQLGPLTNTTYVRATVQNGTCPVAYSSYITITVAQSLPIELLFLKGIGTEKGNLIKWATATEQNNDYFTLLWSDNGNNFIVIMKKDGAGNSITNIEYEYLDESPSNGINYYKLRQTDYDGKYEDSEPISVLSEKESTPVIINCTNVLGQKVRIDEKGIVLLTLKRGNYEYVVMRVNE
jgi:hypothetical protein